MWLYGRRAKISFFALTDVIAPWAPTGLFLGRIGNFINGELWGKTTSPDAPWAVIVNGEARHPSQLYEAFLEGLVLFTVLFLFTRKPRPVMAASGLFLLLYGVFRILVEFVRVPDEQLRYLALGWVTMGQVLSLPMLIGGVVLLVLAYGAKNTGVATAAPRNAPPKKAG
jgi:phosphatidylglycerol:prolipoprotein diacylglycerol transferase